MVGEFTDNMIGQLKIFTRDKQKRSGLELNPCCETALLTIVDLTVNIC